MPEPGTRPDRPAARRGELLILTAATRAALLDSTRELRAFIEAAPQAPLRDLAFTIAARPADGTHRLGIVAASTEDLARKLDHAARALSDPACRRLKDKSGLYYFDDEPRERGRLAFLFPGEGSQYPGMLRDLCLSFPEARECFDRVDRAFVEHERGYLPSDFIFPKRPQDAERMWQMDGAVEAVFTANAAIHAVLTRLGIRPDVVAGHSTGDYSALVASGVLSVPDEETFIRFMLDLNSLYRRLEAGGAVPKAMLVAVGSPDGGVARRLIEQGGRKVTVAMDNCPHQFVLAGSDESVRPVVDDLRREGAVCDPLPFGRAYHTPQFRPVCEMLEGFYGRLPMDLPQTEIYSCATAAPLPRDLAAIRRISVDQWAEPVRFRETIEALYDRGVRLFVEVGPRGNLTNFVDDILRGRPHVAMPADVRHRPGLEQLHHLLALLAAQGVDMDLQPLYRDRGARVLALDRPAEAQPGGRRGAARMKIMTGCPPMRLSEETAAHLRSVLGTPVASVHAAPVPAAPVPAAAAPAATPFVAVAPPATAPVVAAAPIAADSRVQSPFAAQIVSAHLQTMDRFLGVQEEVMRAFLTGSIPALQARPLPALESVAAIAPAVHAAPALLPAVHAAAPALPPAAVVVPPVAASAPVVAAPQPVAEIVPVVAAAPAAAPAAPVADRAAIAETLLLLVSERTGYPREMLDPKLDLEADLGIDSIKRVEIFGTFQQKTQLLGPGDMESIGTRKTLQDVIDFIVSRQGAVAPEASPVAKPAATPAAPPAPERVPAIAAPAAVPAAAPVAATEAAASLPRMPLIDTVISLRPGEELVARRTLGLDEDAFLRDHALGRQMSAADPDLTGLPVMPLTMSMEMLAEAAAVLAPGLVLIGMKDVQAHRWIVLDEQGVTLRLQARRIQGSAEHEVRVEIFDETPAAPAKPLVEGTILFGSAYPEAPTAQPLPLKGERPSRWTRETIYREGMFHGPAFRGVASMDRWGADGAEATIVTLDPGTLFRSRAGESCVTDPVLLDQPGQVVGLWIAEHMEHGFVVFPFHLAALQIFGPRPAAGDRLRCQARIALVGDKQVRSDLDVIDAGGRLWARFLAWEDRRFEVPGPLFRCIMSPGESEMSTPLPVSQFSSVPDDARICCRLELTALPRELFEGHGGLWRRVLSQVVLSRRERGVIAALETSKQIDWLLTRVVAKDAARRFLAERYGLKVPPADVEIVEAQDGRLRAEGAWSRSIGETPSVSVGAYGGSLFAAVGEAAAAAGAGAAAAAATPATAGEP